MEVELSAKSAKYSAEPSPRKRSGYDVGYFLACRFRYVRRCLYSMDMHNYVMALCVFYFSATNASQTFIGNVPIPLQGNLILNQYKIT